MNKKGGYHILDFGNATLSDVAVTIAGMYEAIEGNYKKPLLVAGLGDEVAQFGALSISSGNFVITLTDGRKITVTDDDECTIEAGGGGGGATVIDLTGKTVDTVTGVVIPGVYDLIKDSENPVLVKGLNASISGSTYNPSPFYVDANGLMVTVHTDYEGFVIFGTIGRDALVVVSDDDKILGYDFSAV